MKKKFTIVKEFIDKLKATDRGRSLLFFGGYLIFFIILFIIIGTASRSSVTSEDYEKSDSIKYNISSIEDNNYSYKYTITVDVNDFIFEGKRYNDKELFKYNNINYYKDNSNNNIFKKEDNIWIKAEDPNDFSFFTDIDNLKKIEEKATYISKTDYESGKRVYNYEISTTTLEKIISDVDIDLDDKPNELIVSTDEDEVVYSMKLKLDSYGKYKQLCNKYLTIELEYDEFGEIKDIKNPINE